MEPLEEFIKKIFDIDYTPNMLDVSDYKHIAIEFAKMHVNKQQEEIISKVTANGYIRTDLIDFIPKCYSLENIK